MAKNEQNEKVQIPGVTFDFEAVTSLEWATIVDTTNNLRLTTVERIEAQAAFLAKVVATLPDGWGDPASALTYGELRQFSQFEPLVQMMWQSVEDERKKARTPSTTP